MPIYCDTEFNGFGGALISLGLAHTNGETWYEVWPLPPPASIVPWVAENVIPILGRAPKPKAIVEGSLHDFLLRHQGETIVGDHWADFQYLMSALHGPQGIQLNCSLALQWVHSGKLYSAIPHNALADALALMHLHQEEMASKS